MGKLFILLMLTLCVSLADAQETSRLRYWSTFGYGFTLHEFVFGSTFGGGI